MVALCPRLALEEAVQDRARAWLRLVAAFAALHREPRDRLEAERIHAEWDEAAAAYVRAREFEAAVRRQLARGTAWSR